MTAPRKAPLLTGAGRWPLAWLFWLAALGPAAGQADSLGGIARKLAQYEQ